MRLSEKVYKNRPNTIEYAEMLSAKALLSSRIITVYHGNKTEI